MSERRPRAGGWLPRTERGWNEVPTSAPRYGGDLHQHPWCPPIHTHGRCLKRQLFSPRSSLSSFEGCFVLLAKRNMPRPRPVPAGGVFGNARTSGHLYGAIALETGRPLEGTAPTAEDSDYRLPNDTELEWNETVLKTGKSFNFGGGRSAGRRTLAWLPSTHRWGSS